MMYFSMYNIVTGCISMWFLNKLSFLYKFIQVTFGPKNPENCKEPVIFNYLKQIYYQSSLPRILRNSRCSNKSAAVSDYKENTLKHLFLCLVKRARPMCLTFLFGPHRYLLPKVNFCCSQQGNLILKASVLGQKEKPFVFLSICWPLWCFVLL